MSIKQYLGGHPSQNGETNLITECIKRIKPKLRTAIEFGAPTQEYCSNIYHLKAKGWECLYYDLEPRETGITKMTITPQNVNELPACSVLSIDVDGNDASIWAAYRGRPDIVIIEINSSIQPELFISSSETGTSYRAMNAVAEVQGYFPLIHTGNVIYILKKHQHLFPDCNPEFQTNWL